MQNWTPTYWLRGLNEAKVQLQSQKNVTLNKEMNETCDAALEKNFSTFPKLIFSRELEK